MNTARECVCCKEISRIASMLDESTDGSSIPCITCHPEFDSVCLNVSVLRIAYLQDCQHYGHGKGMSSEHE